MVHTRQSLGIQSAAHSPGPYAESGRLRPTVEGANAFARRVHLIEENEALIFACHWWSPLHTEGRMPSPRILKSAYIRFAYGGPYCVRR